MIRPSSGIVPRIGGEPGLHLGNGPPWAPVTRRAWRCMITCAGSSGHLRRSSLTGGGPSPSAPGEGYGFREAGRLLSGATLRCPGRRAAGRVSHVRCPRPHHPWRLRGHDGERQDRALCRSAGGSGHRRRPGDHPGPERRHHQPAAHLSGSEARGLSSLGQRRRCSPQGHGARGIRGESGRAVAKRPVRVGAGWRQDPVPPRGGRFRHLHARQPGRHPRLGARIARGAARLLGDRCGAPARAHRRSGQWATRPHRARCGSGAIPGARPSRQPDRALLAPGLRAGPPDPDRRHSEPTRPSARGVRYRHLLPGEGAVGAGDGAKHADRVSQFQGVARGGAAGHPRPARDCRREAEALGLLHRPPFRSGADVLRDAPARRGDHLDACSAGHDQPARAPLHG